MSDKKHCWEVHSGSGKVACFKHELIRETKNFVVINHASYNGDTWERKVAKKSHSYGEWSKVFLDKEDARKAYVDAVKKDIDKWQGYIKKLEKELEKYDRL